MNKRLDAFTIMEVTVTMLISAILIGITYTSYSIIVKSYHSFTNKNEETAVLLSLDHLLKRDFEKADIVIEETNGIALKTDTQSIHYIFSPDFIIRNAIRTDTFKVQSLDLSTSFEKLPINELQETEEQNRIDDLSFSLNYHSEKIPYHYHKFYSSENLIKRNPNAIN